MQTRLLIGGDWIETGATGPVRNAFTGEEFARVSLGDEGTLVLAIATAKEAFAQTRRVPAHERAAMLWRVVHEIERRRAEFVDAIIREAGKPVVYAEAEVARAGSVAIPRSPAAQLPAGRLCSTTCSPAAPILSCNSAISNSYGNRNSTALNPAWAAA